MNPELLIDELDKFFFHFDMVVEKYGIEKIKTIGDAYMCAGGLPQKNSTNPVEVVMAAIEMQDYMKSAKHKITDNSSGMDFWELRIGIHTGPVISGVIGQKKLSFDIWGDTVNIASRMESSGVAGEINMTGVTYHLTKEFFIHEYRGKMPIKYKGETDMYFVKGIKPELSVEGKGEAPNEMFFIKLQLIRYNDVEEFVLNKLETELPAGMFYHNVSHTKDVITRVDILGRSENVTEEELLLLKTAALLHDVGFIISYTDHEDNSIDFARELLPKYKYSDEQIKQVVRLIDITRVDAIPQSLIEMIIKDADLDYLGRSDFVPISENLFKEITTHGINLTIEEWNKLQYEFISNHTFYTGSAKKLRQVNKEGQLQKLKELVLIFANDGLQKILIVFEKTKDDVTGSDNKYYYFKIKEILSHKYGKTTNTFEYIGKQVYENKDEFYQCLRYSGCGAYMSFFTSENVNIRVFIEGFRRGVGYVAIEYENEGFRSFKEKIQNKNLKETETTL